MVLTVVVRLILLLAENCSILNNIMVLHHKYIDTYTLIRSGFSMVVPNALNCDTIQTVPMESNVRAIIIFIDMLKL